MAVLTLLAVQEAAFKLAQDVLDRFGNDPEADAVEEFLPVVIEDGREIGRREHVNICSTYEQALVSATRSAARV